MYRDVQDYQKRAAIGCAVAHYVLGLRTETIKRLPVATLIESLVKCNA